MTDCDDDDDDDKQRSPRQKSHILNGGSRASSLNNLGGEVMHPAQHLCLTLTIYRCENLVLRPAPSEGLAGVEMSPPHVAD
jgi:hypothetical protein